MSMDTASLALAEKGQFGVTYESGATVTTGSYWLIKVITTATFTTLTITGQDGDAIAGNAFPVGAEIMGKITAFTLASGSILAYKAPN